MSKRKQMKIWIRASSSTRAEMQEFWRVWDLMPGAGHHHMPAGIHPTQDSI